MRIAALLLLSLLLLPTAGRADAFISLCFHDVRADVGKGDDLSMSTSRFVALLTWLRQQNYHPIGVDDLLQARRGSKPLPDKAVLLTFDDGYRDFYSQVFPLLKAYRYPAVLAVVGSWLDAPAGATVDYGGRQVPREKFLSWAQLREMAASGLVEVASHSYDAHRGVPANPQGNLQPALTARIYTPETQSYEDDASYRRRLRADLEANARLLESRLGVRPRVVVWPFGKYSLAAIEAARATGMQIAMDLGDGPGDSRALNRVHRLLVEGRLDLEDLIWRMRHLRARGPLRMVQVDLDAIYDADPKQTERNLGKLVERVKAMQIDTVYLQAFADLNGDGVASSLYFPNRSLPMRADLFNRAAWQLKTRAGVKVYAWLPVLAFAPPEQGLLVQAWAPGRQPAPAADDIRRLSPFAPAVRRMVRGIYADLARHADFDGLLFNDDALLSADEDAHPAALAWRRAHGLPEGPAASWSQAEARQRWSRLKTEYLIDFTQVLADTVRNWRPAIKTARNLFAPAVLDPAGERRFSQSLPLFLQSYDYTALLAMPYLENAAAPEDWLRSVVAAVRRVPGGLKKTVFTLQSVDWRPPRRPLPTALLARHMRLVQQLGGVNFGYYPDDLYGDHPAAELVHAALSNNTEPFGD